MCTFVGQLSREIGFIAMTLAYGAEILVSFIDHWGDARSDHLPDLLAFSVVVYLVVQSGVKKVPLPNILKTIARDATHYFLVIFTSHIVLVMFLAFASVSTSSYSTVFSLRLAYTFIGYNQTNPSRVSDARTFLPFVRSPECSPRNSGTLAHVRTSPCPPKHRV